MVHDTTLRRRVGTIALAVLVLVLSAAFTVARPDARPGPLWRDFNAFYCAGDALRNHADPYRAEPLGSCERRTRPRAFEGGTPGLAMPAPLPPYALATFIPLAFLPFTVAGIVWSLLSLGALVVTVISLRRASGLPVAALTAAFILSDGYVSLCLGQIAPLAIAMLALATMFVAEGRDRLAAIAASLAMIEPHVGLPASLALFILRPRSRLVFAASAIVCGSLSLVVAGAASTLEYFRDVVPAHGLSEVANEKQLSFTYALHRLGVTQALALRAGEMWYLCALVLGVWAARAVSSRHRGRDGLVVAIPSALAVIGGPFVHIAQIPAAMPAALLLYAQSGRAERRALAVSIALLAVPWIQAYVLGTIFIPLAVLVAAVLIAEFFSPRMLVVLCAGATALLALTFDAT